MPSLPLHKRDYDVFLSYAHTDKKFVDSLYGWLKEAGIQVWYDGVEMDAGAAIATGLRRAINRCRSIVLVGSEEGLSRNWVKTEYNAAFDESQKVDGFRVIILCIGNANTEDLMNGVSWINMQETVLDIDTAFAILRGFYPGEKLPNPANSRDIYVSYSWHSEDNMSAMAVCKNLAAKGFRLVGDAKDQEGYDSGKRVERIISSCGAFVSIIPFRKPIPEKPGENPYKYFLSEIEFAQTLGLPIVIIADPKAKESIGDQNECYILETKATKCTDDIDSALERLWDDWQRPNRPHYIFCALDLTSDMARRDSALRHLVERVTGMRTIVGTEISGGNLNKEIMKSVCGSFLVLADITDDNLNTCIEAGMALAAGTNLHLISRGKSRSIPFMIRHGQMLFYESEVQLVSVIHSIVRRYRRKIINAEL